MNDWDRAILGLFRNIRSKTLAVLEVAGDRA
jgi:hypothetical protein